MAKTIAEINEKIKKGKVAVVTAEEIIDLVEKKGVERAARQIDIVTSATFGPMCSSGAYFNTGHSKPKIKLGGGRTYLNEVPVYTGLAAVDFFLGGAALPDNDPRNRVHPGEFRYGGGHVIEDLVAGKDVKLVASAYGTDCYPRKNLETWINIKDFNEAVLFNPRNAYQNYNVAVNLSNKVIYTYMGILQPRLGNANYCSAGQLSPLFNIAVIGDLKKMSPEWLRGTTLRGYGVNLTVGIGLPIPILNEEIVQWTAVRDEEIYAQIIDYSDAYPKGKSDSLAEVNYAQLKSGKITIQGKGVPTASLSSYAKARKIAGILKNWIKKGEFFLTEPVELLPSVDSGITFKPLRERKIR